MNTLTLTKKLVNLPSWVGNNSDEVAVGKFIEIYFRKYLPGINLTRQYLPGGKRFNLRASPPEAKLLIVGHLDTVPPQPAWKSDPFKPIVNGAKLIGLGTADMKGSLAAFLSALTNTCTRINPSGLALLFYCDEEYNFQGMKTFVSDAPVVKPGLILSLDGKPFLGSGCRGLIEISGAVYGLSGPSAKPYSGVNVIDQFVLSALNLKSRLSNFVDPLLGPTTTNLAYLQGGYLVSNKSKNEFGKIGNIIPDYAQFLLEIRPSMSSVNAKFVTKLLTRICKINSLKIQELNVKFDYSPWIPDYNSPLSKKLQDAVASASSTTSTANLFFSGFIDTALLNQIFPDVPKFVFGAGGANQHSAEEYVTVGNLKLTEQVYSNILTSFL